MRKPALLFWLALALLPVTPAHAYIGPGVGAGTIAIVLGILSAIFFAFFGIIWYPVKRLMKGRKASKGPPAEAGTAAGSTAASSTGTGTDAGPGRS
jgi:hypothetical protein